MTRHPAFRQDVRGQSALEYAILVAAVSLGVMAASNLVYRAFTSHAQAIEETELVF